MSRSDGVARELRGLASRLGEATQMLRAKPEKGLVQHSDVGRAHSDASQAGLALAQQARVLHLFDAIDSKESEALSCVADFEKRAGVYAAYAHLFLSVCGAAPRKLATAECAGVTRAAAALCAKTADRQAAASDVGMVERAVAAVGALPWRVEAAAAVLIQRSEALLSDALGEPSLVFVAVVGH